MATEKVKKQMYLFLAVVILMSIQNITGQTISQADFLYTSLLSGYNKEIRPATNLSEPTNVSFALSVMYISDIDEPAGKFVMISYLTLKWRDPRMVWTPSSYGGISTITFPRDSVWRPEFSVVNIVEKIALIGHSQFSVTYTYNGSATWYAGDKMESICDVDVNNYPFDSQTCNVMFVPTGIPGSEILITLVDSVDISALEQNDQWKYESSSLEIIVSADFTYVDVKIRMARRYDFFQLIYFAAVIILSILNIFVFMLPAEPGERVGFAITCLLSVSVLLTEVSGQLPPNATPTPKISVFITSMFVLSATLCLLTMLNLRLYLRDQTEPVPKWLRNVYGCLMCSKTKPVIVAPADEDHEKKIKVCDEIRKGNCNGGNIEWKDISILIDWICFFGAFVFNFVSLLIYIISAQF